MIYSTSYINKVISHAYCCFGTLGDKANKRLFAGLDHKEIRLRMKQVFLYIIVLQLWQQNDSGTVPDPSNSITVDERDKIIEAVIRICGCIFNEADIEEVTVSNDYWRDGYTTDDEGTDSYNG